jgi:hypothetical protein
MYDFKMIRGDISEYTRLYLPYSLLKIKKNQKSKSKISKISVISVPRQNTLRSPHTSPQIILKSYMIKSKKSV